MKLTNASVLLRIILKGVLICIFILSAKANEGFLLRNFVIEKSTSQSKSEQLIANINFSYQLNDYLREALLNGVTLKQTISFDLVWESGWLWDNTRPLAKIETELQYHALSQHYQLVYFNKEGKEEYWNFTSLAAALGHMGVLEDYKLPVLPPQAIKNKASLVLKISLVPKAPALPLQLRLLFSEEYSIESEAVSWPLQ